MSARDPNAEIAGARERIIGGFSGSITRRRPSFLYPVGLLAVLVGMVLLPVLYLAFVSGVAWLVHWHIVHDLSWMTFGAVRLNLMMAGLYGVVALAGFMLVVFLLKPFFVRAPKPPPSFEIDEKSQPLLFEFIGRTCDLVGAPQPMRVEVTCEVNASARMNGGIFSLIKGEVVLVIGLPLVGGLTTRQLGGILAHEFGHFRQGAAMRLSYLLHCLNKRLLLMVCQRDAMDEWLDHLRRGEAGWITLFGWLARKFIWLGRKAVSLFIDGAFVVSGFMSRQMEFDADTFMAGFAGSKECAIAMRRLKALDAACGPAMREITARFEAGHVPDNIPALIADWEAKMPVEIRRKVERISSDDKRSWTATHPSDHDRIEAMEALEAAGVFPVDAPASALFAGFEPLCKAATIHYFECEKGVNLAHLSVVSVTDQDASQKAFREGQEAFDEIFGGHVVAHRHIPVPMAGPEQWAAAHAIASTYKYQYQTMLKAWLEVRDKSFSQMAGIAFHDVGFKLHALQEFCPNRDSAETLIVDYTTFSSEVEQGSANLRVFEISAWTRIAAALAWRYGSDPSTTDDWRARVVSLVNAQRCLVSASTQIQEIIPCAHVSRLLFENMDQSPDASVAKSNATNLDTRVRTALTHILEILRTTPDPDANESATLADVLWRPNPFDSEDQPIIEDFFTLATRLADRLSEVSFDLCLLARQIERRWQEIGFAPAEAG